MTKKELDMEDLENISGGWDWWEKNIAQPFKEKVVDPIKNAFDTVDEVSELLGRLKREQRWAYDAIIDSIEKQGLKTTIENVKKVAKQLGINI